MGTCPFTLRTFFHYGYMALFIFVLFPGLLSRWLAEMTAAHHWQLNTVAPLWD